VIDHIPEVVFGFGRAGVAGGEVIRWKLEDEGEEGEDFGGNFKGSLYSSLGRR
jgi:hypothetical protein